MNAIGIIFVIKNIHNHKGRAKNHSDYALMQNSLMYTKKCACSKFR